jgi:hypothetical protein
MSVNIIFDPKTNEPIRYDDEYFILKSPEIKYQVNSDFQGKFTGEGILYITSLRLIIICKKVVNVLIKGFSFPLNYIYEETFKQPFFGKNYLYGKCHFNPESNFGNSNFTVWFHKPPGTIINVLFTLLDSYRNNNNRKLGNDVLKGLKENLFYNIFAIDNNDPSILYDIQPDSIPYQNKIGQSDIHFNNYNRPLIDESRFQNNNPYPINNNNLIQSQILPNYVYKNPGNNQFQESQYFYKNNPSNECRSTLVIDNQELINPYMKNIPEKKNIREIRNSINYGNLNQSFNQQRNYHSNNNYNINVINNSVINNSQQIIYPDTNYIKNKNLNPKGNYPILVNSYMPNNVVFPNPYENIQNSYNNNNYNQSQNTFINNSQINNEVLDDNLSINRSNINNNDNLNNIQNNNLNNKNVELNFNPYPNLEQKENYEKIKNDNFDKKIKVKVNKKDLKYQSLPNEYSYGKINNFQEDSNSLINPYDI